VWYIWPECGCAILGFRIPISAIVDVAPHMHICWFRPFSRNWFIIIMNQLRWSDVSPNRRHLEHEVIRVLVTASSRNTIMQHRILRHIRSALIVPSKRTCFRVRFAKNDQFNTTLALHPPPPHTHTIMAQRENRKVQNKTNLKYLYRISFFVMMPS